MFDALFNLMGLMFILIVIGFILRRKQLITDAGKKTLTDIILYVIIPANVIKSFSQKIDNGATVFITLLMLGCLVNLLQLIIAKYAFNKLPDNEKPCYQYGAVCPNAGFIGNPLAEGVFGLTGLAYASIYLIPSRFIMWTAGISYFNKDSDKKEAYKKVFTHPCMVATYVGIFIMFSGVTLPTVISDTVTSCSNSCTSLTMMYVGAVLADVDFKSVFSKRIFMYCIVRLILIPFIVYCGCLTFGVDPLITGVAVLLPSTPAGSTTSLLASKYNADEQVAAKLVLLSTALSMITIPMWSMILLLGL